MKGGMFDPVKPGAAGSRAKLQAWQPIMPVPEGAAPPPATHPTLGAPAATWEYRNPEGQLLGMVYRFALANGDKEIRSLVYAAHPKWGRQWRWLGFPKPRPLYGLDRLAARPNARVIITEGERAADAASVLLPD